jgi:hypothetical protein
MVSRQVDPAVLGGHERSPEQETANDGRCERVEASGFPADRFLVGRQDIGGGASQRASEVDQHVHAEEQEPDHRRRAVQAPGELECVSVE